MLPLGMCRAVCRWYSLVVLGELVRQRMNDFRPGLQRERQLSHWRRQLSNNNYYIRQVNGVKLANYAYTVFTFVYLCVFVCVCAHSFEWAE